MSESLVMKRLALVGLALSPATLLAATDISQVITDVQGYYDAAVVVGIAVLLFILGRSIVRRVAK